MNIIKAVFNKIKGLIKFLAWTAVVLGVLFVGLVLYLGYISDYKPYKGVPFSSALWHEAGEVMRSENRSLENILYGISPRCGMYDDLTKNYLKKGMHISDVEALLGKPVATSYCMDKKVKCSTYMLGKCYANAFTMSSNEVQICFDKDHHLVEAGKKDLNRKICNNSIIHCFRTESACSCYTNGEAMGKECQFEINKW